MPCLDFELSTLAFSEMAEVRELAFIMLLPLATNASAARLMVPPMPSAGPFP